MELHKNVAPFLFFAAERGNDSTGVVPLMAGGQRAGNRATWPPNFRTGWRPFKLGDGFVEDLVDCAHDMLADEQADDGYFWGPSMLIYI